ncbi:hypothetical protein FHS14_005761 [Paenibacillus baekrokdamisoli]|nr:hypothetical protein [Paenibacillus baekrokdamisoli]
MSVRSKDNKIVRMKPALIAGFFSLSSCVIVSTSIFFFHCDRFNRLFKINPHVYPCYLFCSIHLSGSNLQSLSISGCYTTIYLQKKGKT